MFKCIFLLISKNIHEMLSYNYLVNHLGSARINMVFLINCHVINYSHKHVQNTWALTIGYNSFHFRLINSLITLCNKICGVKEVCSSNICYFCLKDLYQENERWLKCNDFCIYRFRQVNGYVFIQIFYFSDIFYNRQFQNLFKGFEWAIILIILIIYALLGVVNITEIINYENN